MAQLEWTREPLFQRSTDPVAFDIVRGRLVRFSSGADGLQPETWEWDRATWRLRSPATTPPVRREHAVAYDFARGRVVLFGGVRDGLLVADTWEWDGANWTQTGFASAPPGRVGHALAFDALRARTVLFGGLGSGGSQFLDDTWEYDGANWSLLAPATAPPGRAFHAMAYALGTARTVLFGGMSLGVELGDTWTFDGTTWTQRTPLQSPLPRLLAGMTGDLVTGHVVLFGGDVPSRAMSAFGDTWEWDGAQWSPVATTGPLGERSITRLAFDPQSGVLAAGGTQQGVVHGDLWRLAGGQWTQVAAAEGPQGRQDHAMAFDPVRGRLVVFAGATDVRTFGDHWEHDGDRWLERAGTLPPARYAGAMAFDEARGRCVLFGGRVDASAALDDHWELDANGWTRRLPAVRPSPRSHHALAFDATRNRIVLFGGVSTLGNVGDTWEWDGASWTDRQPPIAPAARRMHAMAFDAARGVCLLYGGVASQPQPHLAETWRWNGSDWSLLVAQSAPGPMLEHALVGDAARARVVLLGAGASGSIEAWDWDGASWTQRATHAVPRGAHRAAYDALRDRIALFGGQSPGAFHQDLWHLQAVHAARSAPFGSACSGSVGAWTLAPAAGARPWLGDTVTLRASPVPAPGVALFWLGLSRTTWNGAPLPRVLDAMGMPGCTLLASVDATSFAAATGGAATFALAVPNQPALLGLEAYAQAAALDPPANAFGAVTSNALALRVGAR